MLTRRLPGGLLWQFAVLSLVVVVTLGVALGWQLGRIIEHQALNEAAAEASETLASRVIQHLSPEDLSAPMAGQRYEEFQRFVQESIVSGRTARIRLWGRDGTVIFSDEPSQVGQRFPIDTHLAEALNGEIAMEVSDLQTDENVAERQYDRLLEVYVPIVFPDSPEVRGAFEVYQIYDAVARHIQEAQRSLYLTLAGGLLLLYVAVFAVVKRGHDTISTQQSRLAAMVTEKAGLLATVEERNEQLTSLNRVATDLSRCATLSEALHTGLRLAAEAIGLPMGAIWLLGPGDRIDLAAHRGLTSEDQAFLAELPYRARKLRQVLRSGESLLLDRSDVQALPVPDDLAHRAPTGALAAPLVSRGSVLGALALYTTDGRACTKADLQLAQAIGAELGVTIENARRYEEARRLADRDPVTGLLNHRAFHERLGQELKRSQRAGHECSVVMMDLDDFKLFNDTYGHPTGDQVLREIATLLARDARASDVLARYAGDEFVALLPEIGIAGAVALAERFRQTLADHPYQPSEGPAVPIRMSFGVASYPVNARRSHELMGFADANLYTSKQHGGNTVTGGDLPGQEDGVAKAGSFGVLEGLVTAVDNKDHYTRQHSEDVTGHAIAIAQALGLSEESQRTLRIAGLLHDVGKIGVPDRILRKPGRLDEDEFDVIKQHALLGEMIIKEVPNVTDVLAAVGSHHERVDGRGYPRGQVGDGIPLLGRILAVADAYSAMTSDRPYRKRLSQQEAIEELLRSAGSQLDPELVQAFLSVLPAEKPMSGTLPVGEIRLSPSSDRVASLDRALSQPASVG